MHINSFNEEYSSLKKPGEKLEFSFLMHEINVLPLNYPSL